MTFTAVATDSDGQVVQYQWDFNGVDVIDQTTATGTIMHIYTTGDTFQPMVPVVDNDGLIATATATVIVQPSPFGVVLSANPPSGPPPLGVQFTADAVSPGQVVEYRWDFDGNNSFDLINATDLSVLALRHDKKSFSDSGKVLRHRIFKRVFWKRDANLIACADLT